ncbi:cytochrome P450 [Microbacterium sp. RD1]|uniref:cytochrome P450 n=1 Tax=Microbacterium sp. RD1 TaxID=3457313 RepID=UPI003FA56E7B
MLWDFATALTPVADADTPDAADFYAGLLAASAVEKFDVEGTPYTGIFAYDDVMSVAADTATFSNVRPDEGPRILPLESDPPQHSFFRGLISGGFASSRVAGIEAQVRPMAVEMVDAMVARGSAEFSQEFCYRYPTRVLCSFLGLPDEDWQFHHDWVAELERRTGHGLNAPTESLQEALAPIIPYMLQVVAERRTDLGEDVISDIIRNGSEAGLDDMAITFMGITIMMAGHVTTTSGLSNMVLRLAKDPQLQAFVREHPDRIPDFIEESLRLEAPQQNMPRWATVDTEVGGVPIAQGDNILVHFGSANVDPAHWPDADRFDIDRANKRHLAFGRGVHQCVGAPLARMEMRVALEELLARTSSITVAGDVQRITWPRMAVEEMPLALTAA